jgi:hypothetical protein
MPGRRASYDYAAPKVIGQKASIAAYDRVPTDQFTLGRAPRDRPFHRFEFDDPDKTTIYVSGTAGQVVMWTTVGQRFWNWGGTIPHFLYFESLRVQQQLWSQTVIWTSLLGTFLTVMGIILGVAQFKRGRGGGLSPYRGWFYWHHVVGLVFGVLTLTWVFSGLVSMNPWGFLEGGGRGEASLAQGPSPRWGDVRDSLEMLRTQPALAHVVSLTSAPLGGNLHWMATFDDGSVRRLDAAGLVAQPSQAELTQAAQRIAGDTTIAEQRLVNEEDPYYYSRQRRRFEEVVLPVYRVILNDDDQTRYYLDPSTGALLQRADATGRWRRWLFSGLHRLDFTDWMRSRPFRDTMTADAAGRPRPQCDGRLSRHPALQRWALRLHRREAAGGGEASAWGDRYDWRLDQPQAGAIRSAIGAISLEAQSRRLRHRRKSSSASAPLLRTAGNVEA